MRRVSASLFGVAAIFACAAEAAFAAETTVPFIANVTSTCVLTLGTPGTLGANADFSQLSSKNAGGAAGTVTALTTGTGFQVSASAPTAFLIAPTGGDDNVTFSATYEANGATSVGEVLGTVTSELNFGLTNVNVNLAADKSSGAFPAGAYTAEVVVRCE